MFSVLVQQVVGNSKDLEDLAQELASRNTYLKNQLDREDLNPSDVSSLKDLAKYDLILHEV